MGDRYSSRRRYERRLRIHYRKKVWTASIIMLVVGLVVGFIGCTVAVNKSARVSELLGIAPKQDVVMDQPLPTPTADAGDDAAFTAEMFAAGGFVPDEGDPFADGADNSSTDEQSMGLAALSGMDANLFDNQTAEPVVTEEPTAIPTEAPTAEPETQQPKIMTIESAPLTVDGAQAAVVTEGPTEEPTVEPTEAPTEVPTEAPTEEPTAEPTDALTEEPTEAPTAEATAAVSDGMPVGGDEDLEPIVVEPTAEPTEAPTAEPTATPEPTKAPEIVPYGEVVTFTTEMTPDGHIHRGPQDGDSYETVSITMKVDAYKDFDYFEENYGSKYDLKGGTAAVQLDMTLNDYAGQVTVIPQNFLLITFRGETDDQTLQGYQLLDREIAGNIDVELVSGETTTLYKRYPFSEMGEMKYMVVNTYNGGEQTTYWFEIHAPAPAVTEAPSLEASAGGLTIGSKGDDVKKLQAKLIEMKLLSGQPDGAFGKYTADAVKQLQKKYGMEQTGVADAAFLEKLYSE